MNYKKKIIIGTAIYSNNYGINSNKKKNIKYLNSVFLTCYKMGFRNFDLAPSYGSVEKNFGKLFCKKNIFISSKISKIKIKKNIYNILNYNFNLTLKKLKKKKIDLLYVHNINDFFKYSKVFLEFITNLKKIKKIKKIGFSLYETQELYKLLKFCKPDVVQVPLNIFNQSFLEKKILILKKKFNFKLYARSVFLQGVLLKKFDSLPENFKKFEDIFKKYYKFLKVKKISSLEACLNFSLNSFFDKVIVGVENSQDIIEINNLIKKMKNKKLLFLNLKSNKKKLIDPRKWKKKI